MPVAISSSSGGSSKAEGIETIGAEVVIGMVGEGEEVRTLKQTMYSQAQYIILQISLLARISALAVLELMILAAH